MGDLAGFLLARIAEDEAEWREFETDPEVRLPRATAARVLAECDVKRQIVEAEASRRRTKDNVSAKTGKAPEDLVTVTWTDEQYRLHVEQMTQGEYRERFTEPSPPSETLKLLALPYADHPDYRQEWKP
jgi:hypothetical protein